MAKITILRGETVLAEKSGTGEVDLLYKGTYEIGDAILFETDSDYAILRADAAIAPARVYVPGKKYLFPLPLDGDNPLAYPPQAFTGDRHILSIIPDEPGQYRNLAENPLDKRGETTCFPHATANVETRNESVFCARNTIDGLHFAAGHGLWPYVSWGIGTRTDARLTLDFGREVEIDKVVLYLRADFPHDAYWVHGKLVFPNGEEIEFPLEGIDGPQVVEVGKRTLSTLQLTGLIKCDMESAFPALRQIEVYGKE